MKKRINKNIEENEEYIDVVESEESIERDIEDIVNDGDDDSDSEEVGNDIEEDDSEVDDSEVDGEDDDEVDEDDDTEDDEDEDDYDGEEPEDEESYRRRMRHKRRVRNQIISYSVIVLLLAALVVGIVYVGSILAGLFNRHMEKKEVEAEIEAMTEEPAEEITIEAPEEVEELLVEEEVEEDYFGDMVSNVIAEMAVEDKVAQLFMITPETLTGVDTVTQAGEGTQNALNTYAVAGLVYSSKNLTDTEQVTQMLATTQEMSKYKLFTVVSEPGGKSGTIASSTLADIPETSSPMEVADGGDSTSAYNTGNIVGGYLSSLGFNVDLAPAADMIGIEEAMPIAESYGMDEAAVADMVAQMVSGLEVSSTWSCLKNFPGTGNVVGDTAKGPVESELGSDILAGQFVPYISGIAAGADMVMMTNVKFINADDSGMPASLSDYMIGTMLRGNLGYDGIVVTAPLNEKAITDEFTSQEAAIAAINAGADIIYMPEKFEDAYQAVLAAVQDGTIPESRIDESLQRIFRVKFADEAE